MKKKYFLVKKVVQKGTWNIIIFKLQVTINSGLTILFDGKDRVYIRAKPVLCSKLRGMCGNFNAQTKDDFWTPVGDIAANANDFGDEW